MVNDTKQQLLKDLIGATKAKLIDQSYSLTYRNCLRTVYTNLLNYADEVGAKYMSNQLQEDFVRDVYNIDIHGKIPNRDFVIRSTNILLDMQRNGEISIRKVQNCDFPEKLASVFNEFFNATRMEKQESTLKTYHSNLMITAKYLDNAEISDISQVSREIIGNYILTLSKFSGETANRIILIFSQLLKFANEKGYINENISNACMKVRLYRDNKIPSVFEPEEIEKTLSQIDRETPMGKRDYALLLLSARTGLRSGDIRKLMLKNIRFDTNTIEIIQSKTGSMLVLPLMEDVGLALIDYLKNSRPQVKSKYIFVIMRAPFNEFSGRMNTITKKYMEMADIENVHQRRPGFHAFRHSLASSMLKTGTSILTIKGFLGHNDTNTTMGYVKIDVEQLSMCALEVPYV